jgi:hypothetical protein
MAVFPPSMTHEGNLSDEKKAEIDRLLDEAAKPRMYIRPDGAEVSWSKVGLPKPVEEWPFIAGNIETANAPMDQSTWRENALRTYTLAQREQAQATAVCTVVGSAEWSRQLRVKVKQAKQKTAVKVLVDLQDEP